MARNKLSFLTVLFVGEIIMMVGVFWIITLWRTSRWISYWESRLDALERSEPPVTVRAFGDREYQQLISFSLLADRLLVIIAQMVILMSLTMLVASLFLA